nr:hypothetical protein [Tanacetum cinerariifolium]
MFLLFRSGGGLVGLGVEYSRVCKYRRGKVGGVAKISSQGEIVVATVGCRASGGMTNRVMMGEVSGVCSDVSNGVVGGVVM